MIGSLFAGTDESPGETVLFQGPRLQGVSRHGIPRCHGAGRTGPLLQEHEQQSKLVPEGIEGRVPYKGTLSGMVYQLVGGLRAGMGTVVVGPFESFKRKAGS